MANRYLYDNLSRSRDGEFEEEDTTYVIFLNPVPDIYYTLKSRALRRDIPVDKCSSEKLDFFNNLQQLDALDEREEGESQEVQVLSGQVY